MSNGAQLILEERIRQVKEAREFLELDKKRDDRAKAILDSPEDSDKEYLERLDKYFLSTKDMQKLRPAQTISSLLEALEMMYEQLLRTKRGLPGKALTDPSDRDWETFI